MKSLFSILLILFNLIVSGQEGIPYITHFNKANDMMVNQWSICQTNQNVMLFANRLGVTSYDGNQWKNHRLPIIPFEIRREAATGIIYAGAAGSYGRINEERDGKFSYSPLSGDSDSLGVITSIWFSGSSVCFAGEQSITIYNPDDPASSRRWYADQDAPFTGYAETGGNFYINVAGKGLHRIDSDTLFPIVTGYLTNETEILFILDYSPGMILLGTSDNRLRLFDGIKYYPFAGDTEEYLAENILSDGIVVTDSLYAFSTLYGGVILVKRHGGKLLHKVNYQNGLPDDEIFAMGSDINSGLWISHGMGICRVDLSLPLRSFSHYPGLEGTVTTTIWYNDELWVATNEGLWYLDEVRNYTEVEVWLKRPPLREPERINTQVQIAVASGIKEEAEQPQEEKSSLKRAFSRLFGNKKRDQATPEDEKTEEIKSDELSASREVQPIKPPESRYVRRKVTSLKSIDNIYRKVEGLNARCNMIAKTDHGLLVATTAGLYAVFNHQAVAVTESRYINSIEKGVGSDLYYISTDDGIMEVRYNNNRWETKQNLFGINEPLYSMVSTSDNVIWASGLNILFNFTRYENSDSIVTRTYTYASDFPDHARLAEVNDTLMLFTENEILYFSDYEGLLKPYAFRSVVPDNATNMKFLMSSDDTPWINEGKGWRCFNRGVEGIESVESLLRIFDRIISIRSDSSGSFWVTDRESGVYRITGFNNTEIDPVFSLFINNLSTGEGIFNNLSELEFEPYNNTISVNISAPHYLKETSTSYQYFIEGLMKSWSPLTNSPNINLFLKSGTYTVLFRAVNVLGIISPEKQVTFTIKPPFTRTIWFYILISLGAIAIIIFMVYLREKKLHHDNRILEEKVQERTIELEKKREQIEIQRDEILKQKEEITSSITYASRIQNAILPGQNLFRKAFTDHFIFHIPRDIVSGDFYWIYESKNRVSFAVADCTGHGVPGAIMSMLGISLLNEISAYNEDDINPSYVLGLLREKIIFSLKQSGHSDGASDGMDISFCSLNRKTMTLDFAGAFNPLYHFRDGVLTEYKADRMPVGYHGKQSKFTNHTVSVKKGDAIYLFSDGYYDQFGGNNDKKFSSARFRKMIQEISSLPMDEQKGVIQKRYRDWKRNEDQVDDILVVGIRL